MSIKSLNQKGFGAMEAVLIVVIVAILAGTGYYVYQANNKTNETQTATHTTAESAVVTSTTSKSAVAAGAQSKKTYGNLLDAYKKNASAHKDWDTTYVDGKSASNEFTDSFKTAVKDGTAWDASGPFCTSDVTFGSLTVDKATLSGDTATVTLAQTASSKKSGNSTANVQSTPMKVKLTLKYADKNWAIDKQECVSG